MEQKPEYLPISKTYHVVAIPRSDIKEIVHYAQQGFGIVDDYMTLNQFVTDEREPFVVMSNGINNENEKFTEEERQELWVILSRFFARDTFKQDENNSRYHTLKSGRKIRIGW